MIRFGVKKNLDSHISNEMFRWSVISYSLENVEHARRTRMFAER